MGESRVHMRRASWTGVLAGHDGHCPSIGVYHVGAPLGCPMVSLATE